MKVANTTPVGRKLYNMGRMIGFFQNWPVAAWNRLGMPSNSGTVEYRLRSGFVFEMEPGPIDVLVLHELLRDRIYEPTADFVVQHGWTVVDLGAHKGAMTVAAAATGPHTFVHAVEPEPVNLCCLRRNLRANGLSNVRIWEAAVWKERGHVELALNTSWSHAIADHQTTAQTMLRVPTVTIPEILAAIDGDVDLLKFNVEGAEFDVLESMTTGDFARIKRITVQYHDQEASGALQPRTGARLQSLLEAHGYRCLRLPDARLLFAVHAEGTRV